MPPQQELPSNAESEGDVQVADRVYTAVIATNDGELENLVNV